MVLLLFVSLIRQTEKSMMNNLDSQKKNLAESCELESKKGHMQSAEETIQDSEITWLGDYSICCKKLKHYQAFSSKGNTVSVYSFAIIMGEEEEEHVGYLEDMYEDYRRQKMVKVRWFNRSEEMSSGSGLIIIAKHELIMTPDVQVVSAECVDGIATVLSPKHYEQCLSIVSQDFSDGIFVCSRQIKKNNSNNKISSFPLCKLRGYSNQTIFSILNPPNLLNRQEEKEEVQGCFTNSALNNQVEKDEESQERLKVKASIGSEVHCFGVGDEIEVLSEDSGIRGCWFRCKILKATEKRLQVVYKDVKDVGGPGNIKEWIDRYRVSAPDKLGMRCLGRYTIRPLLTSSNAGNDDCYSIGSAVDAWWCDAWWEGIVVTTNVSGDTTYRVYFPDENRMLNFDKEQLRSSKDWVHNKWIQVNPKPDILSFPFVSPPPPPPPPPPPSSSSNVKFANNVDVGGGGSGSFSVLASSETEEAEKGGMKTPC